MVLFNYSTRELTAKIVYYGPGICGKTTNLQFIHENLPGAVRGKMLSLATKTDRTLFFDFLPIDLGEIRGMKTRVQLYTVPGQVFYNETRKLVLKGVDGIVFVADSQETMLGANVESFKNLEENLKGHGMKLADLPHVIQFNKRDLPKLSGIEDMNAALNKYNAPFYESVAVTGIGVQDTLKAIVKLVLLNLTRKYDSKSIGEPAVAAAPSVATSAVASVVAATVPVARSAAPVTDVPPAPVATHDTRRHSIPLSTAPAAAPSRRASTSRPPDSRKAAPPPVEATATFAEEEIDGLVGEVAEIESPVVEAPAEEGAWMGSLPADEEVGFANDSTAYGSSVPIEDLMAKAEQVTGSASGSGFEIDRGFDPEWTQPEAASEAPKAPPAPSFAAGRTIALAPMADLDPTFDPEPSFAPAPAGSDARPEDLVPIMPFPLPEPERASDASADGDVLLTDVASDSDLFSDPSLEIAQLADGQTREIIVPVMLGDGASARRFKLAIRLRLDALE
jgi:signal recognition particle receptor subunit beta